MKTNNIKRSNNDSLKKMQHKWHIKDEKKPTNGIEGKHTIFVTNKEFTHIPTPIQK
jgi:hypothetical protein